MTWTSFPNDSLQDNSNHHVEHSGTLLLLVYLDAKTLSNVDVQKVYSMGEGCMRTNAQDAHQVQPHKAEPEMVSRPAHKASA
jgi:hypothetical protein